MRSILIFLLFVLIFPVFPDETESAPNKSFSRVEVSMGLGLNGVHLGAALIPHHHFYINGEVNSAFWLGFNGVSIGWQQPLQPSGALRIGGGIANGYANNPASSHSWTGLFGQLYYQQAFKNVRKLSWLIGGCFISGKRNDEDYKNKNITSANLLYALTLKLF